MRKFLLNSLTILMVGALAAGAVWYKRQSESEAERIDSARRAVERLAQAIKYHAATGETEVNGRGWPKMIEPAWFEIEPPNNPLVPHDRPWLEIASPEEAELTHPPVRQSVEKSLAAFWYNPANGALRARVGAALSDKAAIEQYNRINTCRETTLFDASWVGSDLAAAASQRIIEEEKTGGVVVVRRVAAPTPAPTPGSAPEQSDPPAPSANPDEATASVQNP